MAGLRRGELMSDPQVTKHYLLAQMRHYEREVFACLLLDNQHRVIAFEQLFLGTIDGSSGRRSGRRGLRMRCFF